VDVDQRGADRGGAYFPAGQDPGCPGEVVAITAQVNQAALTSIRLDGKWASRALQIGDDLFHDGVVPWWASASSIGSVELVDTA
jgi:hypothetical protein